MKTYMYVRKLCSQKFHRRYVAFQLPSHVFTEQSAAVTLKVKTSSFPARSRLIFRSHWSRSKHHQANTHPSIGNRPPAAFNLSTYHPPAPVRLVMLISYVTYFLMLPCLWDINDNRGKLCILSSSRWVLHMHTIDDDGLVGNIHSRKQNSNCMDCHP